MHKNELWTQATSATAATKSKRSRSAGGRAVGRAFSTSGLEMDVAWSETNWQQLWKRRETGLSRLQGIVQ